jgi:hypothetical protein
MKACARRWRQNRAEWLGSALFDERRASMALVFDPADLGNDALRRNSEPDN